MIIEAAVAHPPKIGEPKPAQDVRKLGPGGVYDRLVAARWKMPTTFRPVGDGTRIWALNSIQFNSIISPHRESEDP